MSPHVRASDGIFGRVHVRCDRGPVVEIHHTALAALRPERADRRAGWLGTVQLILGFNLDLDRPGEHGARTYWYRCPGDDHCVFSRRRDAPWRIHRIITGFQLFVRIPVDAQGNVDLRVPLTRSREAVEGACGGPFESLPWAPGDLAGSAPARGER